MYKFLSILLSVACLNTFAQIPTYVPTNGLQAYWSFTGNANDLTVNAYTSTINGATPINDRFGNSNAAYSFNGTSDNIVSAYGGVQGAVARAVSFWARSPFSGPECVLSWGSNSQGNRFACSFNYSNTGVSAETGLSSVTYSSPSNTSDNKWHHYVFQFSAPTTSMIEVYQDGVFLSTVVTAINSGAALNTTSAFNVTFGRMYDPNGDLFFNGGIDDIGIWNRRLSLCEIYQLYLSTAILPSPSTSLTTCAGAQATFEIIGGTSYTWSAANTGSSLVSSVSTNTMYFVVVTNTNTGCAATYTFVHNIHPTISAVASNSSICAGQTIQYNITGATNYTWSNGGTGASQTYTPSSSGLLIIHATNSVTGCSQVFSFSEVVNPCLGIAAIEKNKVAISPNPFQTEFSVQLNEQIESISVYDALGNCLIKQSASAKEILVDGSQLKSGVYFVKVRAESGQLYTQKIILQP